QVLNDRDRVEQRHRVVDEHGYLPERVKLQKVVGTQRLGIERQHLDLVIEPELLQQPQNPSGTASRAVIKLHRLRSFTPVSESVRESYMAPRGKLFAGFAAISLLAAALLGAYASHGMQSAPPAAVDAVRTAVEFQFYHGLALLAVPL